MSKQEVTGSNDKIGNNYVDHGQKFNCYFSGMRGAPI